MKSQDLVEIIEEIVNKKDKKVFTLGTVDPNYTSGAPKILFDGEGAVSTKRYSYLSSYKPAARDRVLLVNISGTHIIVGKIMR